MGDNRAVEALLEQARASIPVPPGGPDRILAARDAADARRAGTPPLTRVSAAARRHPRALALATAAVAVLVAVGAVVGVQLGSPSPAGNSGSRAASSPASGSATPLGGPSDTGAGPAPTPPSHGAASSGAAGSATIAPSSPNQVPPASSKVVETGTLTLEVARGQLPSAIGQISSEATGAGGFVANSSASTATGGEAPSGDVTIRVPVASFGSVLAQVERVGKASAVTTSGQDVTSQYVDLQARLQSLEDARTQMQQILTKAQSISDILPVEDQISGLQTQIEQIQGQINVLDNQATYSTLSVHLVESVPPAAAAASSGIAKAWGHARRSFTEGMDSVVAATGGIAVFLVAVGMLALVVAGGWRLARRRFP